MAWAPGRPFLLLFLLLSVLSVHKTKIPAGFGHPASFFLCQPCPGFALPRPISRSSEPSLSLESCYHFTKR
ncbi:hypothetical protein B0T19DRAFT_416677 [Cercophora scortea]|uniref:Uncharacterized protein n=1 Tax=Cercophora scortea TaxID=314031 RepID=A0AAE0IXG5_9PEZI|nr:hypothetical protein B0T19DRAFT_416677 [Cercophora scortea]